MPSYHIKYGLTIIGILILIRVAYRSSVSDSEQASQSPSISHAQDWAPDKKTIDDWKNKAAFLNCPIGSDRRKELLGKLNNLATSKVNNFCTCPQEVTFLVMTNMPADVFPVSEQIYRLCGCKYVHIRLDNKTAWPGWQYSYKVCIGYF